MQVDIYKGKTKILKDAKWCGGFANIRGYILRKKGDFSGMVLTNNADDYMPIHMVGVLFPLNIYWINKLFKVVQVKEGVKPFVPLVSPDWKSSFVLESVKPLKLKAGDRIEFKFTK